MSAPLCPMCGAESPRSCDLEDECDGACPWVESGQHEDDDADDSLTGLDPDQDCGRWDQRAGGLAKSCRIAGSEDCEFCPYRGAAA